MKLLLVEDEPKLASVITRSVERQGWSVDVVDNGTDAIWRGTEFDYDVIVLDVGIPAPDGFEVCRTLRSRERWAPVLFVTAREAIGDRVAGLDAGGDDYLVKPFALEELSARLRSLARRTLGNRPTRLVAGDLTLDPATRIVTRRGDVIDLSPREFAVLEMLMRRNGEVVTRTELLDHVWHSDFVGTSNVVDVYIGYLREKIDRPYDSSSIATARGVGYRLDVDDRGNG